MAGIPQISDAEWEVMKVIWEKSPITANEVIDQLSETTTWNHRTIRTLLNRLVKKKAVGFHIEGKHYQFFPKVTRETCTRQESESFIARVFDGAASPLLAHFVKQKALTTQEIEELKEILASKTPV